MKVAFRPYLRIFSFLVLVVLILSACGTNDSSASTGSTANKTPTTVHLGYFPNITHAAALVGVARGTFQQAIGPNTLDTKTFNAGPSLIEALLAGSIDIGYVGPNPAINGYVKSHGEALRIIAGASSGGALFIVRPEAGIKGPQDLNGKKIAVPQNGGTQDISLRYYLQKHGLKTTEEGGQVQVIPSDNPMILTEFKTSQIDGAWVPEPWASRLVIEGHGSVYLDERSLWPDQKFVTTNVVVRKDFLDQYPDIVNKFLSAHVNTVQYINKNPNEAQKIVNTQLKQLTGKGLDNKILNQAFQNLDITYDPLAATLFKSADNAYALGFLGKRKPNLKDIFALDPLNKVLKDKSLAKVSLP